MPNILITGASGFIGSFLVETALQKGYTTFAGVRNSSSKAYLNHANLYLLELDFSNQLVLENQLSTCAKEYGRFDFVVHVAGLTKSIFPQAYFDVNLGNTQRFVQALINTGLTPNKFIFISSLASYGPGVVGGAPITIAQKQAPVTAYGKSKLAAEQFLQQTPDFPFVILHPTTVYGPREKDLLVLIKSINQGIELFIGNKQQQLSFIHVADVCKAVFLSIDVPIVNTALLLSDTMNYAATEFNGMVKNILAKKTIQLIVPVTLARICAKIADQIGKLKGSTPIFNSERLNEFEANNWAVDASPLKALGFVPDYPLQQGLIHTIDWYKQQGWL
ncbi:MAG: NAD-dependent epimerase [Chitinophagaceae bacterium]|nr:MAG: NAD-dependent [Chitinophagaceae bacterium]TXT34533.1 MAG: NAD-dependent epimerase [Chitinophagaceae bacterium]